jgi:glycosyltransferase involved in cell wall biosynthesis
MHVVYLHPHFSHPGGAGTVVLETAKRLVKMGVKVSIITQTGTSEILKENPGIHFEFIGGPIPSSFSYWIQYFITYKKVEKILDTINPDIIFPQVFPANYWGFLYKKHNPKIPCIWFCHDPNAFVHDKRVINGLPAPMRICAKISNPIMKVVDKKLVSCVDYIIVNSDFTASRCKKIYGISKTETIYPGVDINEFPRTPVEKENYILCVSFLTKFKNIGLVIKSVFLMKKRGITIKLIIIGDGEEKKNLISLSKKLGLTENVFFTGRIDDREFLFSYYARALCVVFPSIDEPFGIVPIEAQAAWTPVIATKSGGPMESVVDGESGFLIQPDSLDELVEKLLYLSQNPSIAESMGISGRKNISKKFTWDKASEQLLEVFSRYEKRV